MALIKKKIHLSTFQTIIIGFAVTILVGSLLLMLPISTRDRHGASFKDALFTSTSAVCVTGLVVKDTATYWSYFGQVVILLLIQVGGMGVVTMAVMIAILSGRKIGVFQRSTMQEAISAPAVGGIVRLTGFIIKTALIIELIGALAMLPVFLMNFGPGKGIWLSVFHSVSAFCNAGFDLMGEGGEFSSLTSYYGQPVINIVVMLLIIVGGLGFLTWDDVRQHGIHIKKYRMQSKAILLVTAILIVVPALYFFFADFNSWENMTLGEKVLASLFQTVTPRTAGFNTVDLNLMTGASRAIILILMLIGGAPGSTAGGIKTTTVAVLFTSALAVIKRREDTHCFKRRIDEGAIRSAAVILVMYLTLFLTGAIIMSTVEGIPMGECLFETASAIGTVGLSLGITPGLGLLSHIILIMLMFFGRVGGLTLMFATLSKANVNSRLPQEKITVG